MNEIITKRLKIIVQLTKERRNKQFDSVRYSKNQDQELIMMSEFKSILKTPPKHEASTDKNCNDASKPRIKQTVLFDDTVNINLMDDDERNISSSSIWDENDDPNNSVEQVIVKSKQSSAKYEKKTWKLRHDYLLEHSGITLCSDSTISEDTEDSQLTQIYIPANDTAEYNDDITIVPSDDSWKTAEVADSENTSIFEENHLRRVTTPEDMCIFEENQSRPLSPIAVIQEEVPKQQSAVKNLIDFHEQQILKLSNGKTTNLSRVDTNILSQRTDSKQALNDSEIISALVRERFNFSKYENRSFNRNSAKKSHVYIRRYNSPEDTFTIDYYDLSNSNTYHVNQSSPIKSRDKSESVNTTYTLQESNSNDSIAETIKEETSPLESSREENLPTQPSEESAFINFENSDLEESKVKNISAENVSAETHSNYSEENNEIYSYAINEDNESTTNSPNSVTTTEFSGSNDKTLDDLSETVDSYNMEEFLKKALGDDLSSYSILDLGTTHKIVPKEVVVPFKKKRVLTEASICTSDASDLISKMSSIRSSFYKTLRKKLKHIGGKLLQEPKNKDSKNDDLYSIFPNNERVTNLVHEAAVQFEVMRQLTKALTVCRNTKEFTGSHEQVEGERLLLVATLKRQAILNEIRRLEYEIEEDTSSKESGTVSLTGITIPARADAAKQAVMGRDNKQWFVCIFSHGLQVIATQPVLARHDSSVIFQDEIIFTDLPPDFNITLEVYSFLQKRSTRNYSHESKFHINKEGRASRCPTPRQYLRTRKIAPKSPVRYDPSIFTSSFKQCGSLKLSVSDLTATGTWLLKKVPLSSSLAGCVSMNMKSSVGIPGKFSGFLTVGTETAENSREWNRRWCVLDGNILRYWNYPCDEDICRPMRSIDLSTCVSAKVSTVDRALCARSRTLLLETVTFQDSSLDIYDVERYLLSADNTSDLRLWESHFNNVISVLRMWNVGCTH